MGKNKQAQRTKNNARPSNSSRSAELLGSAIPNFVGFSAVKDGGYVPVLPGLSLCTINEVEMNNVDANFQIVLKKMNKKDATTKVKALQEFAVMCKEFELSVVEGMLPFWPRLYCALAIDVEHRVREAAQLAHAAVVKRVGKVIALYLKQLAGAWFTSQHDTYPPAASAAQNSFNDTFPQKKVVDAIVHCQREILTYICDNITIHTAQSLSVQKWLTAEEMNVKYQKVLIASLQGYCFYLKKVPIQEIEKMADIHSKIISSNRFWKLIKHDALPVKTAVFNVLASMIENAPILLQDEKKKAITAIMNNLDETEPGLLSAVWECMLVAINKIEDWYSVVNIEKLVLPKLWRVLRGGGQSCASIVYPNLLPFISQFPKLNVDAHNLYLNFFSNMRQGFFVKSVQMSRSEMFAVATSFAECLRYSILLNVNNQQLCSTLLKEQLIPVLEACCKESTTMTQILFCEVTHLIRYWSKNRNSEEYKAYSQLITEFWSELLVLYNSLIDASENSETFDTPDTNNSQIEFLLTLKNAPIYGRKNLKVKFSNPDENVVIQPQTKSVEVELDTVFLLELNNFVNSLCITYFNKINEHHVEKYIIYLNRIITSFESGQLSAVLSKSLKTEINFFDFYNKLLRNWLSEKSKETDHIVELIFNLIKYMSDTEKNEVLKSVTGFEDIAIIRSVIQCALSKDNRNDVIVKKWCSQAKVTSVLIDVAKQIASGDYSGFKKNQNLILLAFEVTNNGELLIHEESANEIISILCCSFRNLNDMDLESFAQLISSIVPLTWGHKKLTFGAVQVLETLFELCSQEYVSADSIFTDTMRDSWQRGLLEAIKKLSKLEFVELAKKLATITWKIIYNSNEEHIKEILVADMAADFLEVIIKNDVGLDADFVREIILTFLTESNTKTWIAEVTGIVIYGEVITGKLYISTLDQEIQVYQDRVSIDLTSNAVTDNTENCMKYALFTTNLLKTMYLRREKCNYDIQDSGNEQSAASSVDVPGFANILINIIYSIILGQLYGNHYKSTKFYNSVNKLLATLQENFKQLQTYINEDVSYDIVNHIKTNYSNYSSMLSYIIHFCCTELSKSVKPEEFFECCNSEETSLLNKEIRLQAAQVLSECMKLENDWVPIDDDISALIVARSLLKNQEDISSDSTYVTPIVLEKIMLYEKENVALLLFECDISKVSWEQLRLPVETIRLLTELVRKVPTKLTPEQWNFILISLVSWQLSVIKSKESAKDFKVETLAVAVCQLYQAVQSLMYKHEQQQIDELPLTLLDEWKNVFVFDIQSRIMQIWMFYADLYADVAICLKQVIALDSLGKAVKLLDGNVLFNEQSNVSSTPINLDDTIQLSLKLLQSPSPSIQLSAYHVLKHVVSELVQRDKTFVESESFDPETLSINLFEDSILPLVINTVLGDFKLRDPDNYTIQPYTYPYEYTVGYMLIWAIILDMCAKAHGDLRYQYAEILKDKYFPCLLNNIFRLMPVEVLQDNKYKGVKLGEIFTTTPTLDFGESWTEWRFDHIVCWVYVNCLRHLPVLVRQWRSTADSRVSSAVDKITTHYVSPMLCQEELLNNRMVNIENMQIKVHPTAREVVALYQMDDTKLELSIVLPPNHPLGPVTVEPGQHAGGTANWRNCHMQLSIFLTHQNGSVWDGLALWKRNLDKKFAGIEECYICFSIFHISSYQIPKLSCHTCRKKFHTACLYKWFSTSQKSTCPICRNVF